jgi:hypothetical protein
MGDVIFLCRATLRQLIQVAKGNYKAVKVSTQSSCGLYDPGMGGGSLLGIELVKDVIIPKTLFGILIPQPALLEIFMDCGMKISMVI